MTASTTAPFSNPYAAGSTRAPRGSSPTSASAAEIALLVSAPESFIPCLARAAAL